MTASTFSAIPTITCGVCHVATDAMAWRETTISGELPPEEYQCPSCGYAFKRERTGNVWKPIQCVQIPARL